jgi:hypothetical protein
MTRDVASVPVLGRLRFGLRRETKGGSGEPAEAPPALVELVAYAEDCILSGSLVLEADRLTDHLDDHHELKLVNVHVRGLESASTTEVSEFVVERDDLLLVHASGPRGDRGRRRSTQQVPVRLHVGPYRVRGYLHVLPGSDPITSFSRRRAMVPLTEASIEYESGASAYAELVGTVIVNRALVGSIVEDDDDIVALPEHPVPNSAKGDLVKDFSYEVHYDSAAASTGIDGE